MVSKAFLIQRSLQKWAYRVAINYGLIMADAYLSREYLQREYKIDDVDYAKLKTQAVDIVKKFGIEQYALKNPLIGTFIIKLIKEGEAKNLLDDPTYKEYLKTVLEKDPNLLKDKIKDINYDLGALRKDIEKAPWERQSILTKEEKKVHNDPDRYETVLSFDDGYKWVRIKKPGGGYSSDCELEGKLMGHCGNLPKGHFTTEQEKQKMVDKLGKQILYSLRDKNNDPHVSVTVDENGKVQQARGRFNKKPEKKFMPYIADLFKTEHIKGIDIDTKAIHPHNNVFIHDFNLKDRNDLVKLKKQENLESNYQKGLEAVHKHVSDLVQNNSNWSSKIKEEINKNILPIYSPLVVESLIGDQAAKSMIKDILDKWDYKDLVSAAKAYFNDPKMSGTEYIGLLVKHGYKNIPEKVLIGMVKEHPAAADWLKRSKIPLTQKVEQLIEKEKKAC